MRPDPREGGGCVPTPHLSISLSASALSLLAIRMRRTIEATSLQQYFVACLLGFVIAPVILRFWIPDANTEITACRETTEWAIVGICAAGTIVAMIVGFAYCAASRKYMNCVCCCRRKRYSDNTARMLALDSYGTWISLILLGTLSNLIDQFTFLIRLPIVPQCAPTEPAAIARVFGCLVTWIFTLFAIGILTWPRLSLFTSATDIGAELHQTTSKLLHPTGSLVQPSDFDSVTVRPGAFTAADDDDPELSTVTP